LNVKFSIGIKYHGFSGIWMYLWWENENKVLDAIISELRYKDESLESILLYGIFIKSQNLIQTLLS
jgi:hypothetical protein